MQTYFSKNNNQECILVGCVPSAAVAMSIPACIGHCVSQHALERGDVFPGGVSVGGVCPGQCVSQHALRQTPPVNRMIDRCKNITFPQLRLQTVKMNIVVLVAENELYTNSVQREVRLCNRSKAVA